MHILSKSLHTRTSFTSCDVIGEPKELSAKSLSSFPRLKAEVDVVKPFGSLAFSLSFAFFSKNLVV